MKRRTPRYGPDYLQELKFRDGIGRMVDVFERHGHVAQVQPGRYAITARGRIALNNLRTERMLQIQRLRR